MATDLIETTLPLSPDKMVEFFKDKSKLFFIKYSKNKDNMSAKSVLVYLANLQINAYFDVIDEDLITEYLYLKDIVNCNELSLFLANILYYMKFDEILYETENFKDLADIVIKKNKDILRHYLDILESSPLFILSRANKALPEISRNHIIEEYSKLGFCFLSLYKIPDFLITFLKEMVPLEDQKYFEKYFNNEEFMFKGQSLFHYFSHPNNLFFALLVNLDNVTKAMSAVEETSEEVDKSVDRMVKIYDLLQSD